MERRRIKSLNSSQETGDNGRTEMWKWLRAHLVVAAVLLIVFATYRVNNRIVPFDAVNLFSPYFTLVGDLARAGRLLLWNPWTNCGSPDVAYVEMGSFSPLTIALAWATGGGDYGFVIYWLTILLIAGSGMIMLGRQLGAPPWVAMLVSIAFIFSGFYLGHSTHTSWLYSLSFLPWMVWNLERGLARRHVWPTVCAGALYGMSALAGHPAIVILNGLYLASWALGRWMFPANQPETKTETPTDWTARGRMLAMTFGHLAIVLSVGVAVLSPAYFAFLVESKGYADRAGQLPREIAVSNQYLPVGALTTISSPYVPILKLFNPTLWPDTFVGSVGLYVGPFVLALAVMALVRRYRDGWVWWLLLLAILSLTTAFGPALPLRGWLYDLCPPTRYFRGPAVISAYFLFSIASLALIGGRELAQSPQRWRTLCGAGSLLFIAALVGFATAVNQVSHPGHQMFVAQLHLVIAWLGVPLATGIAWRFGGGFAKYGGPTLLVSLTLVDTLLSCLLSSAIMGISSEHFQSRRGNRERSVDLTDGGFRRQRFRKGDFPHNANLFSKVATLENFSTLNNRFHTRSGLTDTSWHDLGTCWSDQPQLAAAALGDRRVWFSEQATEADPSDENFYAFVSRSRALGAIPIAIHDATKMSKIHDASMRERSGRELPKIFKSLPAAQPLEIELIRYAPVELKFQVDCPSDGWLLVTDRWANGWTAKVNSESTKVWGGNFLFRAIAVKEGRQTVEFRYQPFGYPWLLLLSWGTLLVVAATTVSKCLRNSRK